MRIPNPILGSRNKGRKRMCQCGTQPSHYNIENLLSVVFEGCFQFVLKNKCLGSSLPLLLPIIFSRHSSSNLFLAIRFSVPDNLRNYSFNGFIKLFLLQLAFPDNNHIPPLRLQLPPNLLISLLVPYHLCNPEVCIRLWNRVIFAVFMSMPEAAVDENDRTILGENDVRTTWEIFGIDSITEPSPPKRMTQKHFRTCILGSVMRHTFKTLLWGHRKEG